jgi:hypothetical protein
MSRLTQRVTAVWTTVKCPRCGTQIDPEKLAAAAADATPPEGDGKRWSFVWTPPRGDFCPECEFPMSKYFGRLRWIRTLGIGAAMVIMFVTLQIIGSLLRIGEAYTITMQVLVLIGGIISIVGIIGIVVGGKHVTVRASDWSKPG